MSPFGLRCQMESFVANERSPPGARLSSPGLVHRNCRVILPATVIWLRAPNVGSVNHTDPSASTATEPGLKPDCWKVVSVPHAVRGPDSGPAAFDGSTSNSPGGAPSRPAGPTDRQRGSSRAPP